MNLNPKDLWNKIPPVVRLWTTRITKNAIIAATGAVEPMIHDPGDYNLHNWHGASHILGIIWAAIAAREMIMVILPLLAKLAAWAQSGDNGNGKVQ